RATQGTRGAIFIHVGGTPRSVRLVNNLFVGHGVILRGPGELSHNLALNDPGLVDRIYLDYRLECFLLSPTSQYVHPGNEEPRPAADPIDIGAYQYAGRQ